jgi:hypothetical protein
MPTLNQDEISSLVDVKIETAIKELLAASNNLDRGRLVCRERHCAMQNALGPKRLGEPPSL